MDSMNLRYKLLHTNNIHINLKSIYPILFSIFKNCSFLYSAYLPHQYIKFKIYISFYEQIDNTFEVCVRLE